MKKRILLGISTLALALFGMGCLLQPLTPEEEAELRADMDQYEAVDGEGTIDEADDVAAESDTSQLGLRLDSINADPSDLSANEKPDPTPWVASDPDRKPDPTPWRPMSSTHKPDPTPWNPMGMELEDDGSADVMVRGGDGNKPDPTPWRKASVR